MPHKSIDGFARWDVLVRNSFRSWITKRAKTHHNGDAALCLDGVIKFAKGVLANEGAPTPVSASFDKSPGKQKPKSNVKQERKGK